MCSALVRTLVIELLSEGVELALLRGEASLGVS